MRTLESQSEKSLNKSRILNPHQLSLLFDSDRSSLPNPCFFQRIRYTTLTVVQRLGSAINLELKAVELVSVSKCVRLAQLVRSLTPTANQKVPRSITGLVEGRTLGDLFSPHRRWTGTLSSRSSLSTFYQVLFVSFLLMQ